MTSSLRFSAFLLSCVLLALGSASAQQAPAPLPTDAPVGPPPADVRLFDPAHTRFGFELRTRWGQRVAGEFPKYEGEVTHLPDGRHKVRIVLSTAGVVVSDSPRYTSVARGPSFFDAARFPYIEFVSDPHPESLIRTGGRMRGRLSMHGVSRVETFYLDPAECDAPGKDCDVVAGGSISRDEYGLDGWHFALVDRVRFSLRVRVLEPTP